SRRGNLARTLHGAGAAEGSSHVRISARSRLLFLQNHRGSGPAGARPGPLVASLIPKATVGPAVRSIPVCSICAPTNGRLRLDQRVQLLGRNQSASGVLRGRSTGGPFLPRDPRTGALGVLGGP